MLKKIMDIIDEIFEEISEQLYFMKCNGVYYDVRLTNYAVFASYILAAFNLSMHQSEQHFRKALNQLHIRLKQGLLLPHTGRHHIRVCKSLLLHIEFELLQDNDIYSQYWTDLSCYQQQYKVIALQLPAMHKNAIWEISGTRYIVGVPFVLYTDLWLKPIKDISGYSSSLYRLSDLLPLKSEDFKLIREESEVVIQLDHKYLDIRNRKN